MQHRVFSLESLKKWSSGELSCLTTGMLFFQMFLRFLEGRHFETRNYARHTLNSPYIHVPSCFSDCCSRHNTLHFKLPSHFLSFQLIHSCVVDTSIVFPHRLGLPYKRALKNLMAEYLKKIIQDDGELISWISGLSFGTSIYLTMKQYASPSYN